MFSVAASLAHCGIAIEILVPWIEMVVVAVVVVLLAREAVVWELTA